MAAVVLSSEEPSYFTSSPLRRSKSQPKFSNPPSSYSKGLARSSSFIVSPPTSASSSEPSSPRTSHADSTATSFASTPASSISLEAHYQYDDPSSIEEGDQILFPMYDDIGYFDQDDLEPTPSLRTSSSTTISPTSNSTSTNVSRPESPVPIEHAEDDTAVRIPPSKHVDYLSHNWKEEDIWSSWKHIVSKRKTYNNSARLENASWRTWMKSKNKLKTVSPETLNWLKDCDVTWLYGPLQTGSDKSLRVGASPPINSQGISTSSSFLHKKPILKKRSMSEIMLQRSLSASSLIKQAAAAVQAQQLEHERPGLTRGVSDYVTYPFSSRRMSRDDPSRMSSINSSGIQSPGTGERKHIHFNEQVEQCIAVDVKGDDEDEIPVLNYDDDSDSDDGGIMMKRSNSKRKLPTVGRKPLSRTNSSTESKTIAMLPSTTLKYREDTPEPQETAMKHSNYWSNTKLSPSPSQETLKPSKPSSRMLLGDDDDDDLDTDWEPQVFLGRRDSISVNQERYQNLHSSGSSSSLNGEPSSGMRRTPSGMFMPYEEDDDAPASEGLFGKVVDTVNTARDIAHVIWNVGWRR
ncbi:protein phosphatase-like protein type 1 complex subunit Hex2/Reg1 [Xylogone sp. PMI_703]|nr:protein phosphatase-like protein type 1 complex subunit Hex2/Reg1 [Xylogone sp. PMI_703]